MAFLGPPFFFFIFFFITIPIIITKSAMVNDAEALLKIKQSLNNSQFLDSWKNGTQPCDEVIRWVGVVCGKGIVTTLRLRSMNLSGDIDVTALAQLQGLRVLNLVNNSFSGPIPEFNKLGALKAIYVSMNNFSGEIPSGFFTKMVWLKKVWFDKNNFTGPIPSSLAQLPRLLELYLNNNNFSGLIPSIGQQSLESLNLSSNNLSGDIPSSLSRFDVSCFEGNPRLCGQKFGKLVSLNVQNFTFLRDDCSRTFRTHRGLLGMNAVHKKLDHCGVSSAAEIDQGFYEAINEPFDLHQTMELVRSLPAGVLIANALLLTAPLEALAETCEAQQSMFNMNMPVLLLVALIGATVGGLLARQRKAELQRLNEQLRQINAALKRQAKIESYAPALSYAPAAARVPENEVIVDPKKQELISHLKNGKNFLRNQNPDKAFLEFKNALDLAQTIKDPIEEKKAARGLGASLQRQGKHREAIKYHMMVLSISEREGEDSGNTEAYGAIADCYTEIGDLERAATFYDQYIARLQAD